MKTNSIGETISAHDSLEDLPHMGERVAPRDVAAIVKAGGYVGDVEWECSNSYAPQRQPAASRHTAGPWNAVGTSVLAADGGTICSTATFARPNEEDEDNARMMASALDMQELLETFTTWARQVAAREDVPRSIRSAAAGLHDHGNRLLAATGAAK